MSQMVALSIIILILYIGDVVSTRTKAWIPSVFVCAVLFLIGYWTFFPADIISRARNRHAGCHNADVSVNHQYGHPAVAKRSWRSSGRPWSSPSAGIAGIAAAVFAVSLALFDRNTALVTIPPLVGGIVSSLIMSQGASSAGHGRPVGFCHFDLRDAGVCRISAHRHHAAARR